MSTRKPLEEGLPSKVKMFRLGPSLWLRLKKAAAAHKTTDSAIIRQALERYLHELGFGPQRHAAAGIQMSLWEDLTGGEPDDTIHDVNDDHSLVEEAES